MTEMQTQRSRPQQKRGEIDLHRRLDLGSLALMLVGLASGALSYWLVTSSNLNPLVIAPSVVATTLGCTHLIKRQAPRR
jgi:ribose/xylose/arabinose/galactoside ABC-type transport system permease subunit